MLWVSAHQNGEHEAYRDTDSEHMCTLGIALAVKEDYKCMVDTEWMSAPTVEQNGTLDRGVLGCSGKASSSERSHSL